MLITENQIRKLIRQSLFEAKGKSREDYEKMLDSSKEKVKSEINKINFLSDKTKVSLNNLIDNTQLILIEEEKGGAKNTKAYALHVVVDEAGNVSADKFTEGSVMVDDKSQEALETWQNKSFQNPRIVINQNIFTIAGDGRTIDHEVRHIKNNLIKWVVGSNKLNADEVKNVLRKDLEDLTDDEIIEKWISEKRFTNNPIDKRNAKGLIRSMLEDYKNSLAGNNQKAVDEFAVRAAALKENPLIMANHQGKSYQEIRDKYGEDVAQIIPFLRNDLKWEDFEAIVKKDLDIVKDMQTLTA